MAIKSFAALALLLASAATVRAATCPAGTFDLGAYASSAAPVLTSNLAKCYNKMRVQVGTDCKITVTPIAAAGVSIPGLFGAMPELNPYVDYASWCAQRSGLAPCPGVAALASLSCLLACPLTRCLLPPPRPPRSQPRPHVRD